MTVTRHVLVLLGAAVLAFGVIAPPEHCPSVTTDQLRASAGEAVDWFVRNQEPDGTWLYAYEAPSDTVGSDYNVVRHAGAVMGLYQAANAGIPGALDAADEGLDWALNRLRRQDDWAAVGYQNQTPVGATALLVAGLVERREMTDDGRHDDLLAQLGRFLTEQTEPSGAVLAYYDASSGGPLPGVYSKYYTGEAYWALARLHREFPDGDWGEVAARIGTYLATRRDDAEDHWPPIPDHWVAYGLAEAEAPLSVDQAAYARRQAELFGSQARWISQRFGPWGGLVRTPHVPRGGGYGVVGEALTGLWLVAQDDPRLADLRAPLAERATCVAGLARAAQTDASEAERYPEPDRARGAWFRDGATRMDDQQHAISALLRTIAIVEAGDAGDPGTKPSAWLWAWALLAAFNPWRIAVGVRRDDNRSRRDRAGVAALGGVLGSVVVLALALASVPLLDATNVSDPALRIAAGAIGTIAGLVAWVARPSASEPALPGWRAALVPIAVPFTAGPGLILLAVSARADLGLGLVAAALVAGVAVLTLCAGWLPVDGPAGRVTVWAARLTATLLAVASILLVLDGVLDV